MFSYRVSLVIFRLVTSTDHYNPRYGLGQYWPDSASITLHPRFRTAPCSRHRDSIRGSPAVQDGLMLQRP